MSTGQPLESCNDVVELRKRAEVFCELVPELTNLVKIMLTLPGSTCTAERSFSGFRRQETYLQSRMKQQRLNSVAIMSVRKKDTKALPIAAVIDDFVCRTSVEKTLVTQPSCYLMRWQYIVLFSFFAFNLFSLFVSN